MSQKQEFIEKVLLGNKNMSALCREFGISRKTGYKWLRRVEKAGIEALYCESHRPHSFPTKTKARFEKLVLSIRDVHRSWGGIKIHSYLSKRGYTDLPCVKTINRILKRHGRICAEESEKHKPWQRFEHAQPNDLWQMDFKGHFLMKDSCRCHPFTLLDDHSRFCLKLKSCANERGNTVKEALIEVFETYGLPARMTMDNGAPWGYSGKQLHTKLTAWLIRLGIKVYHSRPRHPQTQGKLERFHRTLSLELLREYTFKDLQDAQQGFDYWRQIYNEERPHEALGLGVPAQRYRESERRYPLRLPAIEYSSDMQVRKVQQTGIIFYKGKTYRIGEAFYKDPVGLKELDGESLVAVYYCHQKVMDIDLRYPL